MSLLRTNRISAKASLFGAFSLATGSFTPSNNSLLCVIANTQAENTSHVHTDLTITDSAGLTWTKRTGWSPPSPDFGGWWTNMAIWTAPVTTGVSMTVTIGAGGVGIQSAEIAVVDYTDYDVASPVGAVAAADLPTDGAGSITLGSAPATTSEIFGGRAVGFNSVGTVSAATPDAACTEIYELDEAVESSMQVQVRPAGSASTTFGWADVEAGTNTAYDVIGVAIEVKEAAPASDITVIHTGGNISAPSGTCTSDSWTSTAGSIIIAICFAYNTTSPASASIVDDSKGGTWLLAKQSAVNQASRMSIAVLYQIGGARGSGHTVEFDWPGAASANNIAIIEVTGHDGSPFDTTTDATVENDTTEPFNVTAAAAITDDQIAIYASGSSTGGTHAWAHPSGYTDIITQDDGNSFLATLASYKLGETGTPTVGATKTGSTGNWSSILVTFKAAGAAVEITGTGGTVLVDSRMGQIVVADPDPVKIADRGIRTSTSGGDATVTITNPTLIAVGNYLFARVSVDNSGASGALPGLSVTDTPGNTWTVETGALQDPGAASAGIACYLCWCKVANAYSAGATIVFNYVTGSPLSAIVVEEWANIKDPSPIAVTRVLANGGTTAVAVAITPTVAKQLVYVAAAVEGISTAWGTSDSDSTNGTWTGLTKDQANTGTAITSTSVYGGYKVVTASGAQTWNNTLTLTADWAAVAIVFAKALQTVPIFGTPGWVDTVAGVMPVSAVDITGTSGIVTVVAGTGTITADTAVTGTSGTVLIFAGTGTIGVTTALTGTPATVLVFAGTGVVGGNAAVTGTSATVLVFAGTGTVTGHTAVTGASATVLVFAGTGVASGSTDITGTSATVLVFAGTGDVTSIPDITGTSATVLVFAGTGAITADASVTGTSAIVDAEAGIGPITFPDTDLTGTSATVLVFAGTGSISAQTDITSTSAIVLVIAGEGSIVVISDISGTSAFVDVIAGIGQIDVQTDITGISAIVLVEAGTGTVISGSDVQGLSGTIFVFTGIGSIGGQADISGTSSTIDVFAGTGTIGSQANVVGISAIVETEAGTGTIISGSDILGLTGTIFVTAGTGEISSQANLTGTSSSIIVIAGIGIIISEASIIGTSAFIDIIAGIGQIYAQGNFTTPAPQGAILVV